MTVCRDGKYSTVLNRFACICLEFLSERRRAQKVTVCSTGAEGPSGSWHFEIFESNLATANAASIRDRKSSLGRR